MRKPNICVQLPKYGFPSNQGSVVKTGTSSKTVKVAFPIVSNPIIIYLSTIKLFRINTSILVLKKQFIASSGHITMGSFSLKEVFNIIGT